MLVRSLFLALPQPSKIGFGDTNTISNLHDDTILLQCHLVAVLERSNFFPVRISDEIARHIVDHDTLVECMKAEEAVLPSLLLPADIMSIEAVEFKYWCGVLCMWCTERWRTVAIHCSGHRWGIIS
jgi:hypothetical protein